MKTATKKLETTIESFLPVFSGFYGTLFEANEEQAIYNANEISSNATFTYDDMEFDYKDYEDTTIKLCVQKVEEKLKELGFDISIEFQKLVSPRFYNFSNDSINVIYTCSIVTRKQIIKYLETNKEKFAVYCEDHFKSRDGFHSFFKHNVNTWLTEYQYEQLETTFGHMLEFILKNEGYNDYELCRDLGRQNYLDGWLKPELQSIIDDIETYTTEQHTKLSKTKIIANLVKKHKENKDKFSKAVISDIVNNKIKYDLKK